MEHYRAVIKVTFVGAGSIEFTRNVVTDLCAYPEFRGQLHLSLYDISAGRLAHAGRLAQRIAAQSGRGRHGQRDPGPARGPGRRPLRDQRGAGRRLRRDPCRLRHPGPLRGAPDDRRHLGIGGIFRGLRTIPVTTALARDMHDVCPDATLLSYSNPMAVAEADDRAVGIFRHR